MQGLMNIKGDVGSMKLVLKSDAPEEVKTAEVDEPDWTTYEASTRLLAAVFGAYNLRPVSFLICETPQHPHNGSSFSRKRDSVLAVSYQYC
jgi:hypothetical protein